MLAMTLPGLVILLVIAALVERLARGLGSGRRDHPTASAAFDVLGAAFDPGTRHRIEEEHRLELERDDVVDGAPPRSRIDLSAGTAHLMLPRH